MAYFGHFSTDDSRAALKTTIKELLERICLREVVELAIRQHVAQRKRINLMAHELLSFEEANDRLRREVAPSECCLVVATWTMDDKIEQIGNAVFEMSRAHKREEEYLFRLAAQIASMKRLMDPLRELHKKLNG